MITPKKLNKRERRAQQLLAHYATCERLASALGVPAAKADGKKISVALWKLERDARQATAAHCNGEVATVTAPDGERVTLDFGSDEDAGEKLDKVVAARMLAIFGKLPPGFFVNHDARGYALKIDPDNAEGKALIEKCRLHTDWGRNGILSPEIDGEQ